MLSPFYFVIDCFFKRQKEKLIEELDNQQSGNLIDIGIGTGSLTRLISKHLITGIDASGKMLDQARKGLNPSSQLHIMDATALGFRDNSFDYAVLSHVISTSKQPEKIISEATRILKNGGFLYILNHFTPNNWLKYIDLAFDPFSHFFCFKSFFRLEHINFPNELELLNTIKFGRYHYYQLLIFQKK